jgi:hypothetical protein
MRNGARHEARFIRKLVWQGQSRKDRGRTRATYPNANCGDPNLTKQSEITLDNFTSALKTIYGQETEAVLLIFLHWVKNNYDVANATPEVLQEIKEGYLEKYHTAKPLERPDALELLGVYGEHFFKTATPEERAAFAIAIGRTPLEYEIMGEGFSLRELMQALKALEAHNGPAPEKMLVAFFERYLCEYLNRRELITTMPQLIAQYRREPAMKSKERAKAVLSAFGVRLLDPHEPEDMQKWKELSGTREH